MEIFSQPFRVDWRSPDGRTIADREQGRAVMLESFDVRSTEDEKHLRKATPCRLERCWIVNPNYERNLPVELGQWHDCLLKAGHSIYDLDATTLPAEAETKRGHYLPPEARGLPVEPDMMLAEPAEWSKAMAAAMPVDQITSSIFPDRAFAAHRFLPGCEAVKVICPDGAVLFLADVTYCDVPDEAKAYWLNTDELQRLRADVAKLKADGTAKAINQAQQASRRTVKEVSALLLRFDPPNMKAPTKAKAVRAVTEYAHMGDEASCEKVASKLRSEGMKITAKRVWELIKRVEMEMGSTILNNKASQPEGPPSFDEDGRVVPSVDFDYDALDQTQTRQ